MKDGTVSLIRSSPGWQPNHASNGLTLPMCEKHRPSYLGTVANGGERITTYRCRECDATYRVVEEAK